jgi:hypothetical protein
MNPEISFIIEDIKKNCKEQRIADTDKQMYQTYQMAYLLSLLSKEAETQSEKISKQTDALIKFTKEIVWFTVALLIFGAFQIVLMIFKP